MRIRTVAAVLFAMLTALSAGTKAQAASALVETVQIHLYAGETEAAASAARERLTQAPADDEARFLLGGVQFLQALEHLGQEFYRYGITSGGRRPGLPMLPLFRLPVPLNPDPEPIDYQALRGVLASFVEALTTAEATLAGIATQDIDVPLALGNVLLDLNGDGVASPNEQFRIALRPLVRFPRRNGETDTELLVDFDASDVPWLRGYCHLLMAFSEFLLAHDWEAAFEASFHGLFPSADLPMNRVPPAERASQYDGVADFIAFIHLMHWPVVEPQRLEHVLAHLEMVPKLSRENWKRIRAETDKRNEWLPNPQQSALFGTPVTDEIIDGWLAALDNLEALLSGRKLLPHWRFEQGVNVRRIFLEPETFDLVLLIVGPSAIPYLEDGETVDGDAWRDIARLFRGNFFRYAVWFN